MPHRRRPEKFFPLPHGQDHEPLSSGRASPCPEPMAGIGASVAGNIVSKAGQHAGNGADIAADAGGFADSAWRPPWGFRRYGAVISLSIKLRGGSYFAFI